VAPIGDRHDTAPAAEIRPRAGHCPRMDCDELTVGERLREHLQAQGLPADSGVSQRWVRVRLLGLPVVFPNFDARRQILVLHDVHHLLTGYATTWRGEGEIGAYEIATGCRRYWAAWMFNVGGFLFGLLLAPARTWRAFVRGRHGRNFYGAADAAVLQRTVAGARRELGLDRPLPPATAGDLVAFAGWVAVVAGAAMLPLCLGTWAAVAWLR
jgi:hypothetical protein